MCGLLLHNVASAVLRWFQNLSLFRHLGRRIDRGINIHEASDEDMLAVQRWFNPGVNLSTPPEHDDAVTNWIADSYGQVAGFVQLVRHPTQHSLFTGYWLFSLFVKTHLRGLGIGEMLCQEVIARAKQEGVSTLDLLVYEDNDRAIQLYRKLGFEMYSNPELEPHLESERASSGRRRVVMRKNIVTNDDR